MIKHFAADGSVKSEWPEGLHASPVVRDSKQLTQVQGSNAVLAEIELSDGEQVGEAFIPAIANALAADVHPIESALSATSDVATLSAPETPENVDKPITIVEGTGQDPKILLPPVAITPEPEPSDNVTEHHVPAPSEVIANAAHALGDAAEVLKQEEAHQGAGTANAQS
jgi:hypothetical protein